MRIETTPESSGRRRDRRASIAVGGCAWFALIGAICPVERADARVEVNVTRAGYPAVSGVDGGGAGDVIRSGSWTPIVVDVALIDQPAFDGVVRCAQLDTDGDAASDSAAVHLRAETGGSQRIVLYAVANPARERGRFAVELLTESGEALELVSQGEVSFQAEPAQQPIVLADDDLLLLSVSTGTIGRMRELVDSERRQTYRRSVHVAHVSPSDLPELWIGLESVDFVVWDDARPDEMTNRQLAALLTWARMGGTLLIASSHGAGSIQLTEPLYAVLPATIGELVSVDNLPNARRALLGDPKVDGDIRRAQEADGTPWYDQSLPESIGVIRCAVRAGGRALVTEPSIDSALVTRRALGRGAILYAGVTLSDLFRGEGETVDLFRRMFDLNVKEDPNEAPPQPVSLFPAVIGAIAFSTSSSAYLLVASVFSVAYLLCATGGTWWFLGLRRRRHHSWSAFALVALAASALSVVAVGMVRGLDDSLHQISIVDLDAGQRYGHATALFGLKTGTDRRLDVWLPPDAARAVKPEATDGFLRPLPASADVLGLDSSFADPEAYGLVPASALIEDVRVRATLKRFEGRWEGLLDGTISGEIAVRNDRITDASYLRNELGVPLTGCWLMHTVRDIDESESKGYRGSSIYAFALGDIPGDGSIVRLADRCYAGVGETDDGGAARLRLAEATLDEAQGKWLSRLDSVLADLGYGADAKTRAALGEEQRALLLLSTIGEFDPARHGGLLSWQAGGRTWSRDRLRRLDLRERLRRETVVVVGFAADPGPVRLFRRSGGRPFRPLQPDPQKSWTMYRVFIPVALSDGSSPEIGSDPSAAARGGSVSPESPWRDRTDD